MKVIAVRAEWYSRIHSKNRSIYVIGRNKDDCISHMESYFSIRVKPDVINYFHVGEADIIDSGFQGREQLDEYLNISLDESLVFTDSAKEDWKNSN